MLLSMRSIINRETNINKYEHKIFCCNEVAIYLEIIHVRWYFLHNHKYSWLAIRHSICACNNRCYWAAAWRLATQDSVEMTSLPLHWIPYQILPTTDPITKFHSRHKYSFLLWNVCHTHWKLLALSCMHHIPAIKISLYFFSIFY